MIDLAGHLLGPPRPRVAAEQLGNLPPLYRPPFGMLTSPAVMIGCSTSPVVTHLALNVSLTPFGLALVPALFGDTVAVAVNVVGDDDCAMVGATSTATSARALRAAVGIRYLRIESLLV